MTNQQIKAYLICIAVFKASLTHLLVDLHRYTLAHKVPPVPSDIPHLLRDPLVHGVLEVERVNTAQTHAVHLAANLLFGFQNDQQNTSRIFNYKGGGNSCDDILAVSSITGEEISCDDFSFRTTHLGNASLRGPTGASRQIPLKEEKFNFQFIFVVQ